MPVQTRGTPVWTSMAKPKNADEQHAERPAVDRQRAEAVAGEHDAARAHHARPPRPRR